MAFHKLEKRQRLAGAGWGRAVYWEHIGSRREGRAKHSPDCASFGSELSAGSHIWAPIVSSWAPAEIPQSGLFGLYWLGFVQARTILAVICSCLPAMAIGQPSRQPAKLSSRIITGKSHTPPKIHCHCSAVCTASAIDLSRPAYPQLCADTVSSVLQMHGRFPGTHA